MCYFCLWKKTKKSCLKSRPVCCVCFCFASFSVHGVSHQVWTNSLKGLWKRGCKKPSSSFAVLIPLLKLFAHPMLHRFILIGKEIDFLFLLQAASVLKGVSRTQFHLRPGPAESVRQRCKICPYLPSTHTGICPTPPVFTTQSTITDCQISS